MPYEPRTQPWQHQRDALAAARDRRFFAFLMEMGTGKTKVVIDEFCELYEEGKIDRVLVLAPKGVCGNWLRELPTHMPERVWDESVVRRWEAGRDRGIADLLLPGPWLRVLVMNTEALSRPGRAREFVTRYMFEGSDPRGYMVVDESTYIKSPDAERTKAVVKLGDAAHYRRIMTGSPATRSPLDVYSQFTFLKPGLLGQSWWAFRNRHAVLQTQHYGSRKVSVVVGYRNTDELRQKIEPHSFRVTKEECLDLPPKVYVTRDVDLTDEQARVYSELRDYAISVLEEAETVSSQTAVTLMLRLQQVVCGFVVSDDGAVRDLPNSRIDALLEVLEEAPDKAIVWTRFRHTIPQIVEALERVTGRGTVSQFHGGNTGTREQEAQAWMQDSRRRFLVATQQAGGHGNTWTAADFEVYYSNDYSLEHRIQSEDRAHRAGQTSDRVTIVDLVARGTVDERILTALRQKIDLSAVITGDSWKEWVI